MVFDQYRLRGAGRLLLIELRGYQIQACALVVHLKKPAHDGRLEG